MKRMNECPWNSHLWSWVRWDWKDWLTRRVCHRCGKVEDQ